jgi:hypothetical protein
MHYQISRNGQTYGPYTLEDLARYLASGNVLPTDLAKNEDMADWVPVSQILSGAAPSAAFSTPGYADPAAGALYTPPEAYGQPNPALAASPYADPPNLHWGLYLLFAIITCTLFSKVFTLIQAAWLRRVQPDSNGLFFYAGLYALWIFNLVVGFGATAAIMSHTHSAMYLGPYAVGRGLLTLLYFTLLIVTRFIMSASMEKHFNGPEPIGLQLNPVMTFFFGGVYFQAQINRIMEMKQAARYGAGRTY